MLILKTLALEPMHGYGIAQRIEQVSQGVFSVNAGSLFPAFRETGARREHQGSLEAHRKQPPSEVLRPYCSRPQAIAVGKLDKWSRQSMAIARIMEAC